MDRRRTRTAVVAGTLLLAAACAQGTPGVTEPSPSPQVASTASAQTDGPDAGAAGAVVTPIVGVVPYAPVPVLGEDGRTHLVYEVSLTNYTDQSVTVDKVETLDPATGKPIAALAGADLAARLKPTGGKIYSALLRPGQNGVLFLHIALDAGAPVPAALSHQLTATIANSPTTEQLATTTVLRKTLPVLGPPLAGDGYVVGDGCCDAIRHTRAILPLNGAPELAQRFAIDYEQVGPDNRVYVGNKTDPHSYHIYGQNALAVADATVVATHDGLPEQTPGAYPKDIPIGEADGNHVVLDVGNGFFVTYAHLQPGSVRVQPGQRVRKGDVLGLVGNTGNSVAPHLHVHVTDKASPVVSQGVPYLVDSFTVTGRAASTSDFDEAEANGTPLKTVSGTEPTAHSAQLPLDLSILTFKPQ